MGCRLRPAGPDGTRGIGSRGWPIIGATLSLRPTVDDDTSRPAGNLWAARLQRAWLGRGPLARALWPLSLLYGALLGLRRGLYRAGWLASAHPGVPVIVVGNLVAGGAGKTPTVMALVEHLRQRGWRPGVVSRGYGRQSRGCLEVHGHATAAAVGDEPLLIHRRCAVPVWVAERRIDAARALLRAHPDTDVLVADDGLQHLALARDLAIAVFDDRGVGNGWLLPAGPLREPWRAQAIDLVLHTGERPAFAGHRSTRALADHAVDAAGRTVALADLQGQPLVALAGIARPEAFFEMLRQRGLTLQQTLALPDHDGLQDLAWPGGEGTTVLCTEKDAVKLFARAENIPARLLAVPLVFEPEPAFWAALDARLDRLGRARHPLPSAHGHPTS